MIHPTDILKNSPIKRVVIWGLLKKYHTHRHIHQSYYKNAKKLGIDVLWVEDEKKSQSLIKPGDLIITADPVGKMVPEKFSLEDYNIPIRKDVFYCLHLVKNILKEAVAECTFINLDWHKTTTPNISGIEKWGPVTHYDPATKTLYQPWGTNLLEEEFKKPVFNKNRFVFWIGSIWNDKNNHGNLTEIDLLKKSLARHGLKFLQLRFIPDFLNTFFIRRSRIAPAIGGRFQAEIGYLNCRMFKNISYGQLGVTNVKEFKSILGDHFIEGNTIDELVSNALSLSKDEYIKKVEAQQELIKEYTYKKALENIIKAISRVNEQKKS